MIGVGRVSSKSFYSDPYTGNDPLAHDQLLIQLHTDYALVPLWAPLLGLSTQQASAAVAAPPSWEQVVAHVNRHDYIKYNSVDQYRRELYTAIGRRYGKTLRLWCEDDQMCTRCGQRFRWLTSLGQWRCRYHPGMPLDTSHQRWTCCATRTDMTLDQRLYGCLRCDHTTFERESAYQTEPDTVRVPLVLMDKLNVRAEALMSDCLCPWSVAGHTTQAPPPCSKRHVLTTAMFALDSDDAGQRVSAPFTARGEATDEHVTMDLSLLAARERCCMISLFESSTAPTLRGLVAAATPHHS